MTKLHLLNLLLLLFLAGTQNAFAVEEPYVNELKGTGIAVGNTFSVSDEKFNSPASWALIHQNISVDDVISFEINFDTSVYFYASPFTCTVNFKIYIYGNQADTSLITDSVTHSNVSLQVRYDTARGRPYKGIALYKFKNAHKFKVRILGLTSTGMSPILPVFRLKGQIIVNREYTFQNTSVDVSRYSIVNGNQLKLEWVPSEYPGAEMFDVEYTHIDDSNSIATRILNYADGNGQYTVPEDSLGKWFLNNSTRVTTPASSFLLNVPYNNGYILFRIRSALIHYADGVRWEGDWNYKARKATISCTSGCPSGVIRIESHEPSLNWQYSVAFAEEGKRKEVMSYFDGALYNRQSVTINNSDNKTVVQETIYDILGRPSVSILPVPANDSTIHYFRNFNQNASGAPYSYQDFSAAVSCATNAQPMSNQSGASQYYSENNPFINQYFFNKYIPKAENYPFAVTEYMADNTGRISMQGGVGPRFQIGSDHATKYFYGRPMQPELDRLFGSEAGIANHYLKNMVVDPNGQISVSYIEPGGKTIATALAGSVPPKLHPLSSSATASTQMNDDLMYPQDFSRNASNYSLSATATFLAPVTGSYVLDYKVDPLKLDILFGPNKDSVICNTCYYDLEIVVKDNCNTTISSETRSAGQVFDTSCNSTSGYLQDTIGLNIQKIGEYYVTYSLRISQDALNFFDSVHLVKNSDLRKFNSFLLEELKGTDFTGCYSNCETCFDELGTREEFFANFKSIYFRDSLSFGPDDSLYVVSLYDSLLAHCRNIQTVCNNNVCDEKLEVLKMDVTPGGQYALYDDSLNLLEPSINVLTRRNEIAYFTDEAGLRDSVVLFNQAGGDSIKVDVKELNDSLFITYWKDEWADSLVRLHPEYCYYLWCVANSSSYEFDREITNWEDSDTAAAKGWFNPQDYKALLDKDPFFTAINGVPGKGVGLYDKMRDSLLYFSRTLVGFSQSDKNILQLIDIALYCKTQSNGWDQCFLDSSCRSRYREWFLYKHLYLNLKQQFYERARREDPQFSSCSNCFIGADLFSQAGLKCSAVQVGDFSLNDTAQVNGTNYYPLILYTGSTTGVPNAVTLKIERTIKPVVGGQYLDTISVSFAKGQQYLKVGSTSNIEYSRIISAECSSTPFGEFVDSTCNDFCPGGIYDPYDRSNISFFIQYGNPNSGPVNVPTGYERCKFYSVFDLKTGLTTSCTFFNVWVCTYDSTCAGTGGGYGCGSSLSGQYASGGYHQYPDYTLNLSNVAQGATVQVNCDAVEIPNRFSVYAANGSLVATTGWIGYADYSGPWGSSLSTPPNQVLLFTKQTNTYTLKVETAPPFSMSDSWNAIVTCAISGGGNGCANGAIYPSSCADTTSGQLYKNKDRRYPEYVNASSFLNDALSNPQNRSDAGEEQALEECRSNCEALADYWINSLRGCSFDSMKLEELRLGLIDICSSGCSQDNPFGLSSRGAAIKIEAENYSNMEGVLWENTFDHGGGKDIGWIDPGDWLEYAVTIPRAGFYTLRLRVASASNEGFILIKDAMGSTLSTAPVPFTRGWQNWVTITTLVSLPAGQQTIRLYSDRGAWNINWLEFREGARIYKNIPALLQAEDFDAMSGVKTEASIEPYGGKLNVGWIEQGDWMDYKVHVPVSGSYTVNLRVSTIHNNQQFQIRKEDGTVLSTVTVPNTTNFQIYKDVSTTISLSAGDQTLRLYAITNSGWNINWLEILAAGSSTTKVEAESYTAMSGIQTGTVSNDPLGSGIYVGDINEADWMDYSFTAPAAGRYTLRLRVASADGGEFLVKKADGTVLSTVVVPATGGLQSWANISTVVDLPQGAQTIRMQSSNAGLWNVNWMEFSYLSMPLGIPYYFNFEEAIEAAFGQGTWNRTEAVSNKCTAELLANPFPFGSKPAYAERVITETNYEICQHIFKHQSAWKASGFAGSFHKYLQNKLGSSYSIDSLELEDLLKSCTQCNGVLKNNIVLPVVFEPGVKGCITCSEAQLALVEFKRLYGNLDTLAANYETLYSNFFNHFFGFSLSFSEFQAFLKTCTASSTLCNKAMQPEFTVDAVNQCLSQLFSTALTNAQSAYVAYIDSVRREFRNAYTTKCMNVQPSLKMSAELFEYHYTLYYYDQSGNLVKTVPPEGVTLLNAQQMEDVKLYRALQNEGCYQYSDSIRFNNNGHVSFPFYFTNTQSSMIEARVNLTAYSDQVVLSQIAELATGDASLPYVQYGYLVSVKSNKLAVEIYGYSTYFDTTTSTWKYLQKNTLASSVLPVIGLLPLNTWKQINLAYSPGSSVPWKLYIGGNEAALSFSVNEITQSYAYTTFDLIVGSHSAPHLAQPGKLQGTVKNLRIYNRVLTIGEIRQNAFDNCQLPSSNNGLLFWAPMNNAADNIVQDLVAKRNGTLTGFTWTPFTGVYNDHKLVTTYAYNSLNQVVMQYSPDGDTTEFWYDRLGRLTASQNKEQQTTVSYSGGANRYSYTRYDALGRITEVGEKSTTAPADIRTVNMLDTTAVKNWMASGVNRQLTKTIYDNPVNSTQQAGASRKRVTASIYLENEGDVEGDSTLYSYDISGNVKTLLQHVKALVAVDPVNGKKRMDYEYDLVSGKVNLVSYQKGKGDQFFYKYNYDADNRLTGSFSSRDKLVWTEDARYNYYLHGPLARTELGHWKVQGLDYAYTLQGWLKGINSDVLNPDYDMSQDGKASTLYSRLSRDAYGFKLGYFTGDYSPIGGVGTTAFSQRAYTAPSSLEATGNELFNGNISYSTLALSKIENGATKGYSYGYDQLNRLVEMRQHTSTGAWGSSQIIPAYKESIAYDANGNILKYLRQGANTAGNPLDMDSLTYQYNRDINGRLTDNRLNYVKDAVSASNYAVDIDNQSSNNYRYDRIGNLTRDVAEGIDTVRWTVYGKINRIRKLSAGTTIDYGYDPGGNRSTKKLVSGSSATTTYYIRDAQGNVLAVYSKKDQGAIRWEEQHLYGSSRLGMWRWDSLVPAAPPVLLSGNSLEDSLLIGARTYELSNHLGNVLVTISDKKAGHNNSGVVDYYEPEVLSQNDYYPFGMEMPGRGFNNGNQYTFGFNGMRKDNEMYGEGNAYDFGARIYDPRIVRWLSIDPKADEFPWQSPYAAMDNDPINIIDPDGQSGEPVIDTKNKTITVHSKFVFYGSKATSKRSKAAANEIAWMYNGANGKVKIKGVEYTVKFEITYKTVSETEAIKMAASNTDISVNFIRVEKNNTRMSRSFNEIGENNGFMNTDDNLGTSTTAPHEVGHGYGLTHSAGDQRGNGQPDIMAARGTAVDAGYTYKPRAGATKDVKDPTTGKVTGYSNTLNPQTRRVTQQNIKDMFKGVTFDKNGKGKIGTATNRIYDKNGYEKKKNL